LAADLNAVNLLMVLPDGCQHLARSFVVSGITMVVGKGDPAFRFLPVSQEFVAAHIEETLVLHESFVFRINDRYAEFSANSRELNGIPVEAPVGMVAFDEKTGMGFPEERL